MSINTTCPGCGSSLSIDEDQKSVTCQFCGNHFNVNLDDTSPALKKAGLPGESSPADSVQPPPPDKSNPPIPGVSRTAGDDIYNPPIPGVAPTPPADVYNPPLEDISSGSSQPYSPPPFSAPGEPPLISRLTGNRVWIAIAIAVIVIFCVSCLCMAAISQSIIGGIFQ
jgi:hypothetical protein